MYVPIAAFDITSMVAVSVRSTIHFVLLILTAVLLSACATPPPAPIQVNSQAHQASLQNTQQWTLKGRMAFKSPDDKFSANVNWQQIQDSYHLSLNTMLGINILSMHGDDDSVELDADGEHYQDTDASHLIWRITGWQIPVSQFPFWIKGQAAPKDEAIYAQSGVIDQLIPRCENCNGWLINYKDYQKVDDIWLPHNIKLNNPMLGNQILIRVNQWIKQ
ncbi:lipoprotein insertase outer membrane protein LolB [Paraglaciecola chathamensis]|uniref:Outer-membrane lipoprotein LolB n=1 Tax=Paraglaciecola chathamensis TaxID=368405 RepID=A0A8H9IHI2_9ALTE|nr:lipoprotein insertase outer membrane protein LolB [Paraglaciecola oceanifecundans]GGZ72546.1 outer-membrane lipoprotein LolB [Paraglaciecola oceanifecundans]